MNPFADLSLASLHLLRPQWLWALLALPLLFGLWRVRRRRASVWRENVDAHLLPHLLVERGGARVRWGAWLASLAYVLAVIALAGPSWRQSPQPLWQSRTPLVVAVDLSGAALAADLPPRAWRSRARSCPRCCASARAGRSRSSPSPMTRSPSRRSPRTRRTWRCSSMRCRPT